MVLIHRTNCLQIMAMINHLNCEASTLILHFLQFWEPALYGRAEWHFCEISGFLLIHVSFLCCGMTAIPTSSQISCVIQVVVRKWGHTSGGKYISRGCRNFQMIKHQRERGYTERSGKQYVSKQTHLSFSFVF
jgi:hypothetical protein